MCLCVWNLIQFLILGILDNLFSRSQFQKFTTFFTHGFRRTVVSLTAEFCPPSHPTHVPTDSNQPKVNYKYNGKSKVACCLIFPFFFWGCAIRLFILHIKYLFFFNWQVGQTKVLIFYKPIWCKTLHMCSRSLFSRSSLPNSDFFSFH